MAYTISDLPDEILLGIIRHVDTHSLKNARRVCRRWAKAGACRLFRRIYFAPHKDTMEIFVRITSEPAFAIGVTELVYDARVFWRLLTRTEEHDKMFASKHGGKLDGLESDEESRSASEFSGEASDTDSPTPDYKRPSLMTMAARERSYNRYVELYQQQNEILDSGADFLALCQGLQHLVNLKTVSIQDSFGPGSDSFYLHDPLPQWYSKWSSRFFRPTFGPASYIECMRTRYLFLDERYYGEDVFVHHPLDWRGIKNCVKSLAMRRSSIAHLHYGCQTSGLPIQVIEDSDVSKSLETISHELQCLKLNFMMADGNANPEYPGVFSEPMSVIASMLEGAQQLTALSLSLECEFETMYQTLGHLTWPKLTVLELGDSDSLHMDLAFLKSMCQRHKGTLKEVKLRDVMLRRQDGFGENDNCTWDDVGREVGPILELSDLSLALISKQSYGAGMLNLGDRTEALVYQLMEVF